ncbi:MAG: T9SS type A sorting domain-containing protein [Lewinellaceae bacterium]|nr:T9SS type A sorting domain-containing protein [Lewinellaceae bacterium]
MRFLFFVMLALVSSCPLSAQITLEQNYLDGQVSRIKLEQAGEKYYYLSIPNKLVNILNADHTTWKSIPLPLPEGATLTSVTHLSQRKINADDLIEIAYSYYTIGSQGISFACRLINETGTELLTVPNANVLTLSELPGLPSQLLVVLSGPPATSQVYTLPEFALAHTYAEGIATRTLVEGQEVYIITDLAQRQLYIHRGDHTLWKQISLVQPDGAALVAVSNISRYIFNDDDAFEIACSFSSDPTSPDGQFASLIIQEDGTVLLRVPGALGLVVDQLEGQPQKLIATLYGSTFSSQIYNVPDLQLERTYPNGTVKRVLLSTGGPKYVVANQINNSADLFNTDHSPWKSVPAPVPAETTLSTIFFVSEQIINPDPQLEIGYNYFSSTPTAFQFGCRITNEADSILLDVPGASALIISEIPGLAPKLIADLSSANASYVYGLPGIASAVREWEIDNSGIALFPNPANEQVFLQTDAAPLRQITLLNSAGQLFRQLPALEGLQTISLLGLPPGTYFLRGERGQGRIALLRFVVQ